jgi:cyclopropane fatty-acyl-phospholipid synthase-like methyltransferase
MTSYDTFAPFYDAVQGDRAEHAAYVRGLIQKHNPEARTLLELACGTGSILNQLRPHYEVMGLDQSEAMLEIAAEKVAGVRLVQADMTSFRLRERFDVVLCLYDSINHLLRFSQWEQVFARARGHLHNGGIFVFDVNTEHRLRFLSEQRPVNDWFGDGHLLVLDVEARPRGIYLWHLDVFEGVDGETYQLHTEKIPEVAFSTERIRRSLDNRFRRVWTYDQRRSRPTTRSERLHFVCRT